MKSPNKLYPPRDKREYSFLQIILPLRKHIIIYFKIKIITLFRELMFPASIRSMGIFVCIEKRDYFTANFVDMKPISPSFTPMCFATTGHLAFKRR